MAEWLTEGASERSAQRLAPILHLLVKGPGDGFQMWCTAGRGVERTQYHVTRRCPDCRKLAQEAVDDGTLSPAALSGWKITGTAPDPTGDQLAEVADPADQVAAHAALWSKRAERLAEQALDEIRDEKDAISSLSGALMALRISYGEAPDSEMDGCRFPGEDVEVPCTCPADLRARGGFRSTCDAHGVSA